MGDGAVFLIFDMPLIANKASYYRARYYDPGVARFISEDPVRVLSGMNFYGYVLNNGPNLSDPSGNCPPADDDDCHKFADLVDAIARRTLGSRPDTPGLDRRLFMDELARTFTEFPSASLGYMSGAEGTPNQHVPHFGSSGFADPYFEQDVVLANGHHIPSNQVRHATGGLLVGYVLGTTPGLGLMNSREDPDDPIHGVPDINLNGKTVPMGSKIANPIGGDAAARGLADWIRKTLCKQPGR